MPTKKIAKCLIVCWVVVANGCVRRCDCVPPPATGEEFFPLEIGHFVEYDVQEQEFALGRPPAERNYQRKELIAEKYQNIEGQMAYRMVRFWRNSSTQTWQPDSTFTLRITPQGQAIRNENGRDFVKLVFPAQEKGSWNGNLYNSLGEDEYEYKNLGKSWPTRNQNFERSVTVVQQADSTLVGQDKRTEVYAAAVGLVYQERVSVQFCSSSATCVGKAQIDFGKKQWVRFRRTGRE